MPTDLLVRSAFEEVSEQSSPEALIICGDVGIIRSCEPAVLGPDPGIPRSPAPPGRRVRSRERIRDIKPTSASHLASRDR
jgi:hypothetical protein